MKTPAVDLAHRVLERRRRVWMKTYQQPLVAFGGKDHLVETLEEAADQVIYYCAEMQERQVAYPQIRKLIEHIKTSHQNSGEAIPSEIAKAIRITERFVNRGKGSKR